jgi:hypothetical protein
MKSRMALGILIVAIILPGCSSINNWIFDSLVDKIPPQCSAYTTIVVMKQRILRYARLHDSLPKSPRDLPEMPGKGSENQDAWGREILMSFADGKATLTSLGRDGKPGGTGEDADMSGVFPLKDKNGEWAGEDVDWVLEPKL